MKTLILPAVVVVVGLSPVASTEVAAKSRDTHHTVHVARMHHRHDAPRHWTTAPPSWLGGGGNDANAMSGPNSANENPEGRSSGGGGMR